jgi:hypothetical protein
MNWSVWKYASQLHKPLSRHEETHSALEERHSSDEYATSYGGCTEGYGKLTMPLKVTQAF